MSLISALAAAALSFPTAEAACLPDRAEACVLTLQGAQAPRISAACLTDDWKRHLAFGLQEKAADSNGDGWREGTLPDPRAVSIGRSSCPVRPGS